MPPAAVVVRVPVPWPWPWRRCSSVAPLSSCFCCSLAVLLLLLLPKEPWANSDGVAVVVLVGTGGCDETDDVGWAAVAATAAEETGLDVVNDKSELRALLLPPPTRRSSGWPKVPPDRFDGGLGSAVRYWCCGCGGPRANESGSSA